MVERSKVLVTGGAGYIGSHTIVELLQRWDGEVVSVDNFANSDPRVFDRIEMLTGRRVRNHAIDICDRSAVNGVFTQEKGVVGVIHFAAFKSVPESVAQPHKYYHNNLVSLANMLQACSANGVDCFIFSSSCSVYGNIATLPVSETSPLGHAESPYAYTKQIGERMVDDHTRIDAAMKAISLRYFNPAGAHTSGLLGEDPINAPSSLVPLITRAASGRSGALMVHGTDYPTRDGSCIRDYVHVSDIADAHIRALEHVLRGQAQDRHTIINLGTGAGVSVLEAIRAFESISGLELPHQLGPRRAGDVSAVYSDTTRSRAILGWTAKRDLHEMMRSAWAWEQHLAQGGEV